MESQRKVDQKGLVNWSLVKVQSFTLRDLLHGLSKEQIQTVNVFINEVPEHSKSILKQTNDFSQSNPNEHLMQLTVGNNVTVFNLDEKDRYEVALINSIENF